MNSAVTVVSSIVGKNIRDARRDRGRTQQDLADLMCDAGFRWSRSTVARVEFGARPCTVDELAWAAIVLDVPHTQLMPAA